MGELELEGADSTLGPQSPCLIVGGQSPFSPVERSPFFFFFFFATAHAEVRENPSGVDHSYCEFWGANSNPRAALQALLSAEPAP